MSAAASTREIFERQGAFQAVQPKPSYDIEAWRRQIPILQTLIPMNNCSQAPQATSVREAAERYLDSWRDDVMDWEPWIAEVERARAEFARLINADPEDVGICGSVSQATAAVAGALVYDASRDTVVVSQAEFPTVGHVWLAHQRLGAKLRWVPVEGGQISIDRYSETLADDVALVSACHGYYQTGFKQDLEALVELTHRAGALLFVDAYQTLGTHPIDVQSLDVDFLASGSLKYLMGVPGIAFLYVKREVAERLEPNVTGWFGQRHPYAFEVDVLDFAGGARRFDTGTPPIPNAYIARAGMEIISEVGPAAIQEWTEELSRRLIEGGRERGLARIGPDDPARKTPSTAFVCPGDSHVAEAMLRERGVIGSARGHVVRMAPHFYSTIEDVDSALDALAEVFGELA